MTIYRILTADDHATLHRDGSFGGSPLDLKDGYIHMSTEDQVAGTLAAHFRGVEGLMLLTIDEARVAPDVKWEASRGGALFPHLYRALTLEDVVAERAIEMRTDGTHIL
ncbi:DUF952 domain-containing protein [Sphingomonas montanisoli]|uniref:DUF952 domain-containing protein n=1 Tax=Sphingomonas montanisoli TaxID=2606412 RepID=A0A5D9CCH5_9SPHN|nr:DUF952 domain-containing protein [Sphingomonas montanisoli]TZG29037.1 DUF952 domain-containing protein [Sphingomonas montanisoli]